MGKFVLIILIVAILLGLLPNMDVVMNMIGTFTTTITTPVAAAAGLIKEFFEILLADYYCLLVFSVLVIAGVIGFVLSWLTGKGE